MANKLYNNSNDIVTITSEDFTGRKLLKRRSNASDAESIKNIFQSIIDKYGLDLEIKLKSGSSLSWIEKDEEFSF